MKQLNLENGVFKAYYNGVEVGDLRIKGIYPKDKMMVVELQLIYYNQDVANSVFTLDAVISCLEPRKDGVIFNLDTMNKIISYSKRVVGFSRMVGALYLSMLLSFIIMSISIFYFRDLTTVFALSTIILSVWYVLLLKFVRKFKNKKI